ncbi:MAG: 2-phospho-L-lactate guanylyltransferase [Pseudomonadales bacterium]|nr:2-phospho-L-lactate guanylyltransferase [Pseudomonadales bacterium]
MADCSTWAVVPVKSFAEAKSRLSDCLDGQTRKNLVLAMLEDVLVALSQVEQIDKVLMVSSEPQALELASAYGALILQEPIDSGLNAAINKAANHLVQQGVEKMLVLPADIPLISCVEIRKLVELGNTCAGEAPTLALVSDQNADGTNAMLVSPPDLIEFSYGEHSYQLHKLQAQKLVANLFFPDLPSFALDIDTPDDLNSLLLNQHKLRADSRTLSWINQNLRALNPSIDAAKLDTARLDTGKPKEQRL